MSFLKEHKFITNYGENFFFLIFTTKNMYLLTIPNFLNIYEIFQNVKLKI